MVQIDANSFSILSAALLGGLLIAACWTDARMRRIPNLLVLTGTLAGLALNTMLPAGMGLFSTTPGAIGLVGALGGCVLGLCALLPLYLLRTIGAGDVKLMAMTGAFLGPAAISGTVLLTLLAGGILALAVASWQRVLRSALTNARTMIAHTMVSALTGQRAHIDMLPTVGTLPYALAITAGALLQILLERHGHALFS
jgi:prepilin peptidase CpaA